MLTLAFIGIGLFLAYGLVPRQMAGFAMGASGFSGSAATAAAPAAGGALGGLGSVAGPVGAVAGGGMGLFSDLQKKKEADRQRQRENEEKYPGGHRRMGQIMNALNAYREQKMAGQLALSQAAFQWADSLRI